MSQNLIISTCVPWDEKVENCWFMAIFYFHHSLHIYSLAIYCKEEFFLLHLSLMCVCTCEYACVCKSACMGGCVYACMYLCQFEVPTREFLLVSHLYYIFYCSDVQTAPDLASGGPFRVAPVYLRCVPITPWALSHFLAQWDVSGSSSTRPDPDLGPT